MDEDLMDGLQQLISEQIEKYHEEKIKRDIGDDSGKGPRPGLKTAVKTKVPQGLLRQYFELN
jgi:hypothetical protein